MNIEGVMDKQKDEIEKHKAKYRKNLDDCSKGLVDFSDVHIVACDFFNYLDTCAAQNKTSSKTIDSEWNQWLAETCLNVLNTIHDHYQTYKLLEADEFNLPSQTAFASMQRLVKEHYPEKIWAEIKSKFQTSGLPTFGFDIRKKIGMNKIILAVSMGIVTILLITIALLFPDKYNIPFLFGVSIFFVLFMALLFIPHPTSHQHDTLRTLLSIAAAGVITTFPGFIEFTYTNKAGYSITAFGSIAIFIIVYLINPAKLRETVEKK